jgi:hypothetical protein
LLAAGALSVLIGACSSAPAAERVIVNPGSDLPDVDVTMHVPAGHQRDIRRYRDGVRTTLLVLGTWLGPLPALAIDIAPEPTRWWTAEASMAPETAAARAASREYFSHAVDLSALPPAFVRALVECGARRGVSKIVDRKYYAPYFGRGEGRYFGGFVPRDLRVQLSPMSGDDRALLTLGTLERWVGTPAFDAIILEFLSASKGARPTLDDFVAVASRVSGQNLAWLFDEALKKSGTFDYAIDALDSRPEADGRFRTTVTVRRRGDATFAGPLPVVTMFADGESVRETMSGRQESATFQYRSEARATGAEVDPDRILLLDRNRGNNGISLDRTVARTAANRWSARWMLWLEDALLTYVAFT